jgi:hypothetical protein
MVMKHFATKIWVDFVRGTTNPATTSEVQKHLDEQCPECLKNISIWRSVMQHTRQSNRMHPPESSVRAVKAGFGLRKVIPFVSGKLDLATLQFDSERQPLVAGVRGSQPSARQLLYRSGSVCIDMRMEPTPGSESIVLVGQLLDSMNPDQGIGGVPVSLMSKGDTVSRKQTNDAGEFDFGLEPGKEIQLVFGIGGSRTIVVSVPEATTQSSETLM